jgi:hypothetical protein
VLGAGYVEERLVDRDLLHERGGVVTDVHDPVAEIEVSVEVPVDDDCLWAAGQGRSHPHRGGDAVGPSLVRGSQNDAAPDDDRLSSQRRIEQLLDRGVERVEINVEHVRLLVHPIHLTRTYVR